jgi:hypothetical protein
MKQRFFPDLQNDNLTTFSARPGSLRRHERFPLAASDDGIPVANTLLRFGWRRPLRARMPCLSMDRTAPTLASRFHQHQAKMSSIR